MRISNGLDKEKKNKITASFLASPVKIHALGLLAVILFFFSLAGSAFTAAPAMAEYGLQRFAISATNENGTPDLQAGSHPYALTNTFVLNLPAEGNLKDVRLELPPGFVGDPNATPHCSYQTFIKQECSNEAVIGVSTTYITTVGAATKVIPTADPVYNLVPPAGVAAEFGFIVDGKTPVFLDTSVRTGADYGLNTTVSNISEAVLVAASKVTIWGVPAAPVHNLIRGTCLHSGNGGSRNFEEVGGGLRVGEDEVEGPIGTATQVEIAGGEVFVVGPTHASEETGGKLCATQTPVVPLLTNPTSCGTPRTASLSVDDWQEPGNFLTEPGNLPGEKVHTMSASLPELSGCEKLDFSPTLGVKPDGEAGSTPTGLNIGLHVPQESTSNPEGLAEADVKDTTVALPAGVQLSPSAADGLQACSNAQIGFTGESRELNPSSEPGISTPQFKEKVYNEATKQYEATLCPDASKIATVKIKTPLLEGELEGSVFLAAPQNFAGLPENPFSSLVAMYLVAEEEKAGVIVKLPGKVSLNPIDGQISTTFENTPQLPFSELKFELYGTDRAPLATPAYCGTYKTEASLAPWSATPSVSPVADFNIASGPNGSACPGSSLPFSPTLETGVPNVNAGSFSSLTTTFSREDGQQNLSGITLHYPPGLSGILTGIPLCGEAEANAGMCSSASEIGETIVSVGLGNDPFSVTGGKVYLTGPYDGAPFGLSIVNPAKAGPFDLQEGRPVIVRAKIEVNPLTAALTVTTTNEIPHIIDGVPLQIKHVNVNITRKGFTFNPTSCNPMSVTGTITSAEGGSATVSDPFQVTNCQALKFTPKFAVSTSGKTSKAKGASLTAKLSEPNEPKGSQANITKVKVELPKQLPSRLTTLQKACTNAQFELNPANCPKESKIGYAVVHTPLLPVPLEGPAIFVSHGGEAFPSLTMVLQGYGVTVDLVGTTFISKAGVTSTTFKTVPDVPFSTFELTLPEGKFSALAANGSLCKDAGKLKMPTEFIGQNGMKLTESETIGVAGCAKAKALTRAQKLQKALKSCKKKPKGKRAGCEKAAKKAYGPIKKAKKKGRK
jgi:hypothetical protein